MMRLMMLMLVAVLAAGPAMARNEKPIKNYAEALFASMDLHWACRAYLGLSAYDAAKITAINGLARYVGQTDARAYVDQMDRRIRNDPRTSPASLPSCQRVSADRLRQIDAERSRLEE